MFQSIEFPFAHPYIKLFLTIQFEQILTSVLLLSSAPPNENNHRN